MPGKHWIKRQTSRTRTITSSERNARQTDRQTDTSVTSRWLWPARAPSWSRTAQTLDHRLHRTCSETPPYAQFNQLGLHTKTVPVLIQCYKYPIHTGDADATQLSTTADGYRWNIWKLNKFKIYTVELSWVASRRQFNSHSRGDSTRRCELWIGYKRLQRGLLIAHTAG